MNHLIAANANGLPTLTLVVEEDVESWGENLLKLPTLVERERRGFLFFCWALTDGDGWCQLHNLSSSSSDVAVVYLFSQCCVVSSFVCLPRFFVTCLFWIGWLITGGSGSWRSPTPRQWTKCWPQPRTSSMARRSTQKLHSLAELTPRFDFTTVFFLPLASSISLLSFHPQLPFFFYVIVLNSPLFFLDGDQDEEDLCRRIIGSIDSGRRQRLLWTIWTGKKWFLKILRGVKKICGGSGFFVVVVTSWHASLFCCLMKRVILTVSSKWHFNDFSFLFSLGRPSL